MPDTVNYSYFICSGTIKVQLQKDQLIPDDVENSESKQEEENENTQETISSV